MTIETTTNKTIQTGNGSNKDFDFAFEIPDDDSLSLTKRESDGSETEITTDFTVTGIADEAGGSVNYPTTGSALTSDEQIIIKRVVSLEQNENLRNQGDYSLEDIEDALDRSVMMCQQLQEEIDRCLKLNSTTSSSYVSVDDFVADRLLVVSADGQSIEMSSTEYGSIDSYLSTLTAISDDISSVAAISSDVTTVAAISSDVTTVAAISSDDISSVAAISSDVTTVAAISSDVTTVVDMTTNIASVVTNMSSILNASSFGFPTATASNVGNHLKLNATNDGYDFVAGANINALAGLTGAANKIPYFTGAGVMNLADIISGFSTKGLNYVNKPVSISNSSVSSTTTVDFGAGTFITSSGLQIYLPAITKKIQSSGSWTSGTGENGLDTGAKTASTFYRTFVIQNSSTSAYDILFSTSFSSPTVPSGYTNLGIIDYALIRVNSSSNIVTAKWHPNDKRFVLGAGESIQVFSSTAGSGNATIINTTEPLEFVVRVAINLSTTGGSDITVYGSEQSSSDYHDCVCTGTNNGFQAFGGGFVYTSDGKIYWKNFGTSGGVTNQTCKIKSIKIRS